MLQVVLKVIQHRKLHCETKSSGLIIQGGLKIEGCKIEGLLYRVLLHYGKQPLWAPRSLLAIPNTLISHLFHLAKKRLVLMVFQ